STYSTVCTVAYQSGLLRRLERCNTARRSIACLYPRVGQTVDKAAFCIRRSKGLGDKADKHEPAALECVNKRTLPMLTGHNREDGRSLFCRFLTATSTHRYAWTSNLCVH